MYSLWLPDILIILGVSVWFIFRIRKENVRSKGYYAFSGLLYLAETVLVSRQRPDTSLLAKHGQPGHRPDHSPSGRHETTDRKCQQSIHTDPFPLGVISICAIFALILGFAP